MYSSLRNSHYRLSIIYSKLEDSDTYTCVSQVDTVCYITVDIIYTMSGPSTASPPASRWR